MSRAKGGNKSGGEAGGKEKSGTISGPSFVVLCRMDKASSDMEAGNRAFKKGVLCCNGGNVVGRFWRTRVHKRKAKADGI
jgi:hypothetical protein